MIRNVLKEGCNFIAFKKTGHSSWKKQTMLLSSATNAPTAGIIVIGDEILKGQVQDSNSHFIMTKLYNIGVRVMKVSVVGDDVDEICHEVRKFSRLYTYVITSGGIGPTHDDVTFEGIAKAFEENVSPHPELFKICSEFYNTTDLSSAAMKLAYVPQSAKLKYGFDPVKKQKSKFPNISVNNVYIFPGVPPLLEKSFTILCEDLFGGSGTKFHKSDLFINEDEVSIAERLSMVVEEFPSVAFGSYPQHDNSYYRVKLTAESIDSDLLIRAVNRLKELLPTTCLVDFDPEPLELSYEKMESLSTQNGMSHISVAVQDMLQAVSSSRTEDTVLCFDASLGGIVTLHMLHAVRKKLQKSKSVSTVLIQNKKSPALDKFLQDSVSRYSLHALNDPCEMKTALAALHTSHPNLQLIIAGCECKSTALHQHLDSLFIDNHISLLAPILLWTDTQILHFVTRLNLPYLNNGGPPS